MCPSTRYTRTIDALTRIFRRRRAAGRSTAHLLARAGRLNQTYLAVLDAERTAAEAATAA